MGDRVSISFVKDGEESVALFSHWDGMAFVGMVEKYVKELKERVKEKQVMPLDRLEPETVMLDFIRLLTKDMEVVESCYYLGKDEHCGDNSDNGHYKINLGGE